jgi:hypothetical protein
LHAFILSLILITWSQALLAAPGQGFAERLADVLFPQSVAWQAVAELPQIPVSQITPQFKERLAEVADECTAQMIKKPGWPDKTPLRRGSLFVRGESDILYIGLSDCHEGDDTLIWRHTGATTHLSEVGTPGQLLRIETSGDHRFTLLRAACCAEVTDDYLIGKDFPSLLQSVSVLRTDYLPFVIPANATSDTGHIVLKRDVLLSSAPRPPTAREASALETLRGLGAEDVLRSIRAGTHVETLLRAPDAAGRYWILVEIKRPISSDGSDGRTTAGWIAE